MKDEIDIRALQLARQRLERSIDWTAGGMARDADGALVAPESNAACCWCLEGALWVAMRPRGCVFFYASATYRFVRDQLGGVVCQWNDKAGRSHADVLKALDVMIRRAEAAVAS